MRWQGLLDQCGIGVLLGGFAVSVSVIVPSPALADACFVTPAKLSDQAVQSLTANLDALLGANPNGGYQLTTQVRSIAGSDTDAIKMLVGLANDANPGQTAAIAAGLAQAATACVLSRPDVSQMIQEAVAASGNPALIAAFAASSGDTQTAALGAGGAGGAGAGGGQGGGAGGVGGPGGGLGTAATNSPTITYSQDGASLTTRGFGNGAAGQQGGGASVFISFVVSPTQ